MYFKHIEWPLEFFWTDNWPPGCVESTKVNWGDCVMERYAAYFGVWDATGEYSYNFHWQKLPTNPDERNIIADSKAVIALIHRMAQEPAPKAQRFGRPL